MAEYKIFFRESVSKDFIKIPKKDLQKILSKIKKLGENPHRPGSEKLTGQDLYRIKQGNYRIPYSIQGKQLTIWVIKVGHRKNIYR